MSRRTIGVLVIVAWLPLLLKLYALFPPTSMQAVEQQVAASSAELREVMIGSYGSVEAYLQQSRTELWLAWVGYATLFALGLASGVAALRSVRGWWFGVSLTSTTFLALYARELLSAPVAERSLESLIEWKQMLAATVERTEGAAGLWAFTASEVVMLAAFLLHGLLVFGAIAHLRRSFRRATSI